MALIGWKHKRKIMYRYDLTAEMYEERYSEEQEGKYKKALENVNVAGKSVLDVGCGSGLFFNQVKGQADLVVGVDISSRLLAKSKEQSRNFQNVFVLQADVDHLPFKDCFFDDIFAFTMLQNMPKPTETLCEIKRVAKAGSKIVVTGLKRAFTLEKFIDILEGSDLKLVAFVDIDSVNCYLAVLST
jgi:ubiquinone/menaquinone biosynthesis C-methylase UbiE